ncbi:MAG TPA: GrpB family protein [Candidatus Bathyarchaeia archaeon]|nr:GrpB family protein [Candidatus Bathyarchaeia archaeon]
MVDILVDHDPRWPLLYEQEKRLIINAIGDKVEDIQHVGSTSVPKLRAKPTIDILVGVRDLGIIQKLIEPLQRIRYEYRPRSLFPPEMRVPQTEYFRKGPSGANTHHIRVVVHQSTPWKNYLVFRDYLRDHPEEARSYERLKIELYSKHGRRLPLEAKASFIGSVIRKAGSETG